MTLLNSSATVKSILLSQSFYRMWTSCVSVFDLQFPLSTFFQPLEETWDWREKWRRKREKLGGGWRKYISVGKDKKKSQDFLDQSWEKIHPHFNKCGSERILLSWRPEWIFLPWKADQERELLLDKSWEEGHLLPHKSGQANASKCNFNRTSSKDRSVVSYKSRQENLVNKSWLKIWLKVCFFLILFLYTKSVFYHKVNSIICMLVMQKSS